MSHHFTANPFQVLGVSYTTDVETINQRYYRLMDKLSRNSRLKSTEKLRLEQLYRWSFEVLTDTSKRSKWLDVYDHFQPERWMFLMQPQASVFQYLSDPAWVTTGAVPTWKNFWSWGGKYRAYPFGLIGWWEYFWWRPAPLWWSLLDKVCRVWSKPIAWGFGEDINILYFLRWSVIAWAIVIGVFSAVLIFS